MSTNDVVSLHVNALFRELPARREERWDLIKQFFNGWYGPISPTDGYTEQSIRAAEQHLQLSLPAALSEWYALSGKRSEVWSCPDRFLAPEELRIENEKLVIYIEAQAVVKWAIPLDVLARDDPPVFVSDQCDSKKWIEDTPAISVFALSQMLLSVKFSAFTHYSANGQATDESLAAITQQYQKLDFPGLNWPPYPTRFYGDSDLVIETDGDTWMWVSGRSALTFRPATELISRSGVRWEKTHGY
jgi:hypothetical protein